MPSDVLKIDARALHDYTARSDKEVSFHRGDLLQVIEKTPDNNWWDGFIQGRRGFIPVAYIEILELNPASPDSTTAPQSGLSVPAPPLRRSSMPVPESTSSGKVVGDGLSEQAIQEETEVESSSPQEPHPPSEDAKERETRTPELKVESSEESPAQAIHTEPPQAENKPLEAVAIPPPATSTPDKEDVKPEPKKRVGGAVKSLTQQYEPPPPGRVLVEPHHTHKRQQSDQLKKPQDGGEMHPRSASSGSKVGMLSSAFESKASSAAGPPPPIKPKPLGIPTSPITEQQQHAAMAFPLMSHGGGYPSVSPLQRAAHMSQAGKPAPPPPLGQQHKKQPSKGSIRGPKRDKSVKSPEKSSGGKPSLPAKPPAPAKPSYVPRPGMGGLYNKDLKEEMQARLKKHHPGPGTGDN